MDTIIILGENGMLGSFTKKYFEKETKYKVIGINRTLFDAFTDHISKLESILESHLTDRTVVFNAIGIIPQTVKNGVVPQELYDKINTDFPHKVNGLCQKYNSNFVHATTDCVYNGSKGNYIETDTHDEINPYGVSKSLGEPSNCTLIRTSIIGEELNSNKSLLEWVRSNKNGTINGFINHYWNGITCLQYAKILEQMMDHQLFWIGVRHIYSPNTVSKFELINLINKIYNLNITINPLKTPIVNKSLSTIYPENSYFDIPNLEQQIVELYNYSQKN